MKFTLPKIQLGIPRYWWYITAGLAVFVLVGFVNVKQASRFCDNIVVRLHNKNADTFVTEEELKELVNYADPESRAMMGRPWDAINLKALEQKVAEHNFVDSVHVWKNHSGDLFVDVWQMEPIMRLLMDDESDRYLDAQGRIFFTSPHHTTRVLLMAGPGADVLLNHDVTKHPEAKNLFGLVKAILADPFCRAQIGELYVDEGGEVTLYPLVGDQEIILGKPEGYTTKLLKLKSFYQDIVPARGWERYNTVNLKYENQIVCE